MPPTSPAYPSEFQAEAVRLYRTSGRSLKELARDLSVSSNSLRMWVRQDETDEPQPGKLGEHGLEELRRLRREVRILREATAFFAKETDR